MRVHERFKNVSEYRLKQKRATRGRTRRGALRFDLDALQASRRETRENQTRANMDFAVYIMQPRTIAFSPNRADQTGSGEYLMTRRVAPSRFLPARKIRPGKNIGKFIRGSYRTRLPRHVHIHFRLVPTTWLIIISLPRSFPQ